MCTVNIGSYIMYLHAHGVFGQFLVKKCRYWPQQVPGDQIDAYMKDKELGVVESFVQDLEGMPFYIHCCRGADYVTEIMSTHGTLDEVEGCIYIKIKVLVSSSLSMCTVNIGLYICRRALEVVICTN